LLADFSVPQMHHICTTWSLQQGFTNPQNSKERLINTY